MEREQYLDILRQNDDPVNWEVPGGWKCYDYEANKFRFETLARGVAAIVGPGSRVETGSEIQDASFIGQVLWPSPQAESEFVIVRASHFGKMVTIFGEDDLDVRIVERLKLEFSRHGYLFIPEAVLDEPYTGNNHGVTGISDWRIRYFDWV